MKLNCAGQSCPEAHECKRYIFRQADHKVKAVDAEVPVFMWASFDIERQHFGNCSAKLERGK